MTKQELRNALSDIEDEARHMRNTTNIHEPREKQMLTLLTRFVQTVREEIVQ